MKKYVKAQIIAKNLPTGSYAAGCPSKNTGKERCLMFDNLSGEGCKSCERSQ